MSQLLWLYTLYLILSGNDCRQRGHRTAETATSLTAFGPVPLILIFKGGLSLSHRLPVLFYLVQCMPIILVCLNSKRSNCQLLVGANQRAPGGWWQQSSGRLFSGPSSQKRRVLFLAKLRAGQMNKCLNVCAPSPPARCVIYLASD